VGSFAFTPTEIILSVGIVAFLALLYIYGLKYLDLLPAIETVKEAAGEPTEAAVTESEEAPEPGDGSVAAGEGQ